MHQGHEYKKENTQAVESKENKESKEKKGSSQSFIFVFGILGSLFILIVIGYFVTSRSVRNLSQDNLTIRAAEIFGVPAAKINGYSISYSDYINDLNALEMFYSNQPEGFGVVSSEQISDQVLVRLIANRLLGTIANTLDVEVKEEDVLAQRDILFEQFGGEEGATEEIKKLYGWTLEEFTSKIIYPVALETATNEAFVESDGDIGSDFVQEEVQARHILFQPEEGEENESVRKRAEKVLERIVAGEDFAVLAAEFGTDGTKETGGDLGYFGPDVMVPAFEKAVFSMNIDDPAQIVETDFGFHIVDVTDKRASKDFASFMDESLRGSKIEILIPVNNPFKSFLEREELENEQEEEIKNVEEK